MLQTKVAAKSSWVYANSPSLSWGKWMGLLKQKIFNTQKTASKETPFLQLAMKNGALTGSSTPWEADGNNFTSVGLKINPQVGISTSLGWHFNTNEVLTITSFVLQSVSKIYLFKTLLWKQLADIFPISLTEGDYDKAPNSFLSIDYG